MILPLKSLLCFTITILGTVQARPAHDRLLQCAPNQDDCPAATPVRLRQATTARINAVTSTAIANVARVEIPGVVLGTKMPNAILRQEHYNVKSQQNGGRIEDGEVKADAQQGAPVQWKNEKTKEGEYLLGLLTSMIRCDPQIPAEEPSAYQRRVAESCEPEKLKKLPPTTTAPWCPPGKVQVRIKARDIVSIGKVKILQEVAKERGIERVLLAPTVTSPAKTTASPKRSLSTGQAGYERNGVAARRQHRAKGKFPNPEWSPIEPTRVARSKLAQRGPIATSGDIENVKEPAPDPNVDPAVSTPSSPVPREKVAVNENFPRTGTVEL
ncbi:hypothetical protein ACJ72_00230 [Emergomyces africanus]|uniref:Uncharacterized protein n=1 Tax=Emergomyces africanus TaxID=1955775 RepID=A0A1B7P8M0_9EURO|nr:hypothetical protein ACJ72_00230 [Emergomyces africanus]